MPGATRDNNVALSDFDRTERLIANTWREILGADSFGKDSNFFALGGDSLKAAQVISRLSRQLGQAIPLRTLFDNPMLTRFAAELRSERVGSKAFASKRSPSPTIIGHPLSFSQERMWFMHALAAASAAYHVPMAIRLQGRLDVTALRAALQQLVQRHDALRTTFISYSTGVSAHVLTEQHLDVVELSLAEAIAEGPNRDPIRTYLSEFTNGTFDLEKGPLLRCALIRTGHDDAVLLLVGHHIVLDQWSLDVVMRELAAAYGNLRRGVTHTPAPPKTTYAEYARWHRNWFEHEHRIIELDFWKRKLADLEPVVLNTDYPRPPLQSFRGLKLRMDFDDGQIAALKQLGAKHRSTLAFVLMTALKVLLHRHTGQTDIAIGVPVANRHHESSERLVGTLVNTLVVRTDLNGRPTFVDALERVRATALEAFEHQDIPFEHIVRELQIPRDASRSPLFSIMFNMLNTPLGDVRFDGLEWSRFDFDKKASQFDLTVTIDADYDKSICFEYSQDLFAPDTMQRLAGHFMRLLRAVIESPTLPIASLPMMDARELSLLDQWSRGRSEPESNATIVELLRTACHERPDAIALIVDDHPFTYREIDGASTRIAHALRERGVRRGMRVGLCMQRSAPVIIAQWATLKCGAAYVPLDPSYPRERLTYMARDARLACLVYESTLSKHLDSTEAPCSVLDIETELARVSGDVEAALDDAPLPSDPAYVIYTSGSTGQPKGVVIDHAAVVNFLTSMAAEPGLDVDDRVLAITTLSFDISVLELLLPWTRGARVVLATREQVADADSLHRMIETHAITLLQATPSTWRMLIGSGWSGSPKLRGLVGGEPLSRELAEDLLARCAEVWNMYGPTETTVWSSCWRVANPTQGISLGHPIRNTRILVLDERLEPCPIGVPGEIHIGGAGLAEGYFDRPELTAQRFITRSAEGGPTMRLYKTGDRGRWRHDGALEHLGRLDSQVKVRGHRIELGEVESHLVRHPGVKQALVIARETAPGDSRLIAYVIPRGAALDTQQVRTQLRESLPVFMLPQAIVALDSLPTLPNGKIDTRRLPIPTTQRDNPANQAVDRTQTEEELCRIWRELLQIDQVGIQDNFFDLGGHSILSVRLVARIRLELRRACTLPMVFRYPTVAALARALERASAVEGSSLIPLQPTGTEPAIYCVCGIQIYQELANRLAPDIPVYGVFVPLELEYLKVSSPTETPTVERLAEEYLRAIRARQPHGPYRLLGFSFGGVLAYEMAQQLVLAGEKVELLAILDSDVPDRRKVARPGPIQARLRALKQHLSRRLRWRFQHWAADEHLKHARDDKYVTAIRSYIAAKYYGPTVLFLAADEPHYDPGYGWHALATGLKSYRIPGDHLGILAPPNIDVLVRYLRRHL